MVAEQKVKPVRIEEEMRASYLDYAMSVIVSRALPDVRDGLKPVQRRILYAMRELNLGHTQPYKKCARIVGEVLGKYHPHGDAPVYDALVRMAQEFSLRYPLVDGQGNFGSIDNDPPAAMRYTEARLAAIAEEMLADIDKDTVDFSPNFDESLQEPQVLPARLPNLLVNGASGIAVGMATNIPPHNLGEVCQAIVRLLDNPDATPDELLEDLPGPDFPTAGLIYGVQGFRQAYATGQGRVVMRARTNIEEGKGGRQAIIVTELPYQVNKAALVARIAELVREKRIEGITDLRDESDREGIRMVVELRREVVPQQVLNNLYKHTPMQSAFFINMVALVHGVPRVITLKTALQSYIDFRYEVVTRRSRYELAKARERAHILEGLKIALDNLDAVIATIRRSSTAEVARQALMDEFAMSQVQAQAVLDMPLRRLAALERNKILEEYAEIQKTIAYLEELLASREKLLGVVKGEIVELGQKYADPRRTEILPQEAEEWAAEDLVPHRQVVVTLSQRGYIKRLPIETYRSYRRGAKGVSGGTTRETDAARHLAVADTHDVMLFFTQRGRVYQLKCYQLPGDASRTSRGLPLVNLLPLESGEPVTAVVPMTEKGQQGYLVLATRRGEIKRTPLAQFANLRSSGLNAMDLEPGDELIAAVVALSGEDLMLVTRQGQAARMPVADVPARSRQAGGVRAVRLDAGDELVAMDLADPQADLLLVSELGYGKLTHVSSYPKHHRGGKGVRTFRISDQTGPVAAAQLVRGDDQLMLVSAQGQMMRGYLSDVPEQDRITRGARIMTLDPGDRVVSMMSLSVGA
ncbi:MAG: DNA gyrase subunit A [Chloroflexi bacterium]|nr:DNA gyrase subunit A [Chloroflexota bacterium]